LLIEIQIESGDPPSRFHQTDRNVHRQSRLAAAALEVSQDDDVGSLRLREMQHGQFPFGEAEYSTRYLSFYTAFTLGSGR
jgi:hypothetical protein